MNGGNYNIKFESDDSANSLLGLSNPSLLANNSSQQYDADSASAAVVGMSNLTEPGAPAEGPGIVLPQAPSQKRKTEPATQSEASAKKKLKKAITCERREERNLREKERSLKITQQIHELRNLLSLGGVIVPKGTKSTILTEAANYIRLLQQHQVRSEVEKGQLVKEVQRIGSGAIQQNAAQNGALSQGQAQQPQAPSSGIADTLGDREYRCVFNSCSVGMAIATMGGSFIDCNLAFTQLSSYSKQELKAMTIFNITSREDLQGAFDMMSQLITPPSGQLDADGNGNGGVIDNSSQTPVILRSAIRNRSDLGLSVSLIRGDDGMARYFNVTLVKLPPSPMAGMIGGGIKPVPATAEMPTSSQAGRVSVLQPPMQQLSAQIQLQLQPPQEEQKQVYSQDMNAHHYTAG
ncbi:hypothetical protein THAOC_13749 [Thalassiosira oceanica]|uniref:BHLH domain-containing protein n=1 Tax=Thalassiosira oceanica TaxID=159749 RepID=K0SGS6_THAOC|nr:hypothetical protein THAOC_13749 [Thalassiosira oceanica]|mmetsp:Transcript_25371/g.60332  ORF Transcript_25371/g.60332 Transcript_25371/m.60332 type:complete len:407 (+) Transcript_25371:246-1466(+)|eukprot:EJK65393.1 hypothetical protein THAOC_13749 [Thalassiosira oceanica]